MAKPDFDVTEICSEYSSSFDIDAKIVNVMDFCSSTWGLKTKLFPVQRFVLKCFYGIQLDSDTKDIVIRDKFNEKVLEVFTEKEFLKYLYEEKRVNTDITEGKTFRELVLVIGRRGTKSTMSRIISLFETYRLLKKYNPQQSYGVSEGSQISVSTVSTSEQQGTKLFGEYLNSIIFSEFFKNRVIGKPSAHSINLASDQEIELLGDEARGTIYLGCGGCSAKSARGQNNIVIILDELAHFLDNGGRMSADAVYTALEPSVGGFGKDGKQISISSPASRSGKFYDLYQESFKQPDIMLMFKMPCTFVNPHIEPDFLKSAYKKDPVSFGCEYGADFSDRLRGFVHDEDMFREKCVQVRGFNLGKPRIEYYFGGDIGLKDNGCGFAAVHKEGDKFILDKVEAYYPNESPFEDKSVLELSDMAEIVSDRNRDYPFVTGLTDQHNGAGFIDHLRSLKVYNIRYEQITDRLKADMFEFFTTLWLNGLVELYEEKEAQIWKIQEDEGWNGAIPGASLVREMLRLEQSQSAKGRIKVSKPGSKGSQDDATDAVVRAIWECHIGTLGKTVNSKFDRFAVTGRGRGAGSRSSRLRKQETIRNIGHSRARVPDIRYRLKV